MRDRYLLFLHCVISPGTSVVIVINAMIGCTRLSQMSKRSLFVCMLGLASTILVLMFACAALYRYGIAKTREVAEVRSDPYGMNFYEMDQDVADGAEIVFLGDSRIEQWSPLPRVEGFRSLNRGQHSQTTRQILGRLHRDVISRRPAAVVLQLGINDLKAIGLFPERKEAIVCQTIRNIELIQGRLLEHEIRPFLLTIIPPGPVGVLRRPLWNADIDDAVQQVNRVLRAFSVEDAIVIDCTVLLGSDGEADSGVFKDTLHLNSEGYARLESLVLAQLTKHAKSLTHKKG